MSSPMTSGYPTAVRGKAIVYYLAIYKRLNIVANTLPFKENRYML